jgi:hypothetical protein
LNLRRVKTPGEGGEDMVKLGGGGPSPRLQAEEYPGPVLEIVRLLNPMEQSLFRVGRGMGQMDLRKALASGFFLADEIVGSSKMAGIGGLLEPSLSSTELVKEEVPGLNEPKRLRLEGEASGEGWGPVEGDGAKEGAEAGGPGSESLEPSGRLDPGIEALEESFGGLEPLEGFGEAHAVGCGEAAPGEVRIEGGACSGDLVVWVDVKAGMGEPSEWIHAMGR